MQELLNDSPKPMDSHKQRVLFLTVINATVGSTKSIFRELDRRLIGLLVGAWGGSRLFWEWPVCCVGLHGGLPCAAHVLSPGAARRSGPLWRAFSAFNPVRYIHM